MKKSLLFSAAVLCGTVASAQTTDVAARARAATAAFPAWNLERDARSGVLHDAFGPSMPVPGAMVRDKAEGLLRGRLIGLGVRPTEWVLTRNEDGRRASYVDYRQEIEGREVVFSHLRFRFGSNKELVRLKMAAYDAPAAGLAPTRTPESLSGAATADLEEGVTLSRVTVSPDWVWYPAPAGATTVLHPAYAFEATGTQASGMPALYRGWVDATTGALLFRYNDVQEGMDLTVKGIVKQQGVTNYTDTVGLPDLAVQVGSTTYYTDSVGFLAASAVTPPVSATVRLQGRWAKVNPGGSGAATPAIPVSVSAPGQTYRFPDSTLLVNAYYHTTRMHGYMKRQFPTFTGLDNAMPVNVNLTSGTCNAFYSNGTMNFYAAGGGCPSYADAASVVYHEYGHAIADKYYNANGAGRMYNGSLNEGYADVWAMAVTRSPIIGPGGTATIRRYDQAAKAFPVNIVGEVHGDGEIIAGAWWDVAVNTGSVDTMIRLFMDSYPDLNDGPAGAEGMVYKQVLVSALLSDDDDNNLNNGTPHYAAIINAFARHGIYYGSGTAVAHNEIAHQNPGQAITVQATATTPASALLTGMNLFYRARTASGGTYDTVRMTASGNVYTATIPAQPEGTLVDYFFGTIDTLAPAGRTYFPAGFRPELDALQVTLPYQFGVGFQPVSKTDFELPLTAGWVLGTATEDIANMPGKWIQAKPVATYQTQASFAALISQTGSDHTTGSGTCLVTGNGDDVDNGQTSVITPAFDLTAFKDPVIEYYRWYGNDRSTPTTSSSQARNDAWTVEMRDTGSVYWQTIENTLQSDYQWRRCIFRVADVMQGIPMTTKRLQVRFVARDLGAQGIVEAALDDFVIYDRGRVTGVSETAVEKARLYPNPANTAVTVRLAKAPVSGDLRLSDAAGRVLRSETLNPNQAAYQLPTGALTPGMYFITVQTEGQIQVHQLVVAH